MYRPKLTAHVPPVNYFCANSFCMKFPSPVSVQWIAELIGAKITGNTSGQATGINEIHKVEPGDLVFVDHPDTEKLPVARVVTH